MYNKRDPTQWKLSRKLNIQNIHSIVRLEKKLGVGSFGVVYKGTMLSNGQTVAVKEQKITENAVLIETEIESLYRVMQNGCGAYAIEIYDVIYDSIEHLIYIIMEYMPGGDMIRYFQTHAQPVNENDPQLKTLCRVLFNGINCIHDASMAHRDIKPANILYNANGQPKLSDFGLGCIRYCIGHAGTQNYMSPDILYSGNREISLTEWQSGDIWAAGCTLFEFVTHRSFAETPGGLNYVSARLFPNVLKLLQATFERDPIKRLRRWRTFSNTIIALPTPKATQNAAQPIVSQDVPKVKLQPQPQPQQFIPRRRTPQIPPPALLPEPLKEKTPNVQPEEQPVYDFVFGDVEPPTPIKQPQKRAVAAVAERVPGINGEPRPVKRALAQPPQRVLPQRPRFISPEFVPEPMELESPIMISDVSAEPMEIDDDNLFSFR